MGLANIQTHQGLEPLSILVHKTDESHGDIEKNSRKTAEAIKPVFRSRIKKPQTA